MFYKIDILWSNMSKNSFLVIMVCLMASASCTQTNVFENNTNIPGNAWKNSFAIKGSFAVTDTVALYKTFIVLRHTDAYKYSNIWLNLGLQAPGDSMRYSKINIELGTDAGGWMGTGMNDIWELRQLILVPLKKAGTYNYSISQIMRDDPLTAVMSAGLRVEKQ
jgi:gliding motility-associated lipoprotein GldH